MNGFTNFLLKSRRLDESKEFEAFLDSHEEVWGRQERQKQAGSLPASERGMGAFVPPRITIDDLGGREAIRELRRSNTPEATLDKMIASSLNNGDRERAQRLDDFRKEFQLQRGEIQAGFRRDFENLDTSFKKLQPPTYGEIQKRPEYMVPTQSLEAQTQAQGETPDRNLTVRKNADDSRSVQVSGQVGGGAIDAAKQGIAATATASRTSSSSRGDRVLDDVKDAMSNLRKSDPSSDLLQQMQAKVQERQTIDKTASNEDQNRSLRDKNNDELGALYKAYLGRGGDKTEPSQGSGDNSTSFDLAQQAVREPGPARTPTPMQEPAASTDAVDVSQYMTGTGARKPASKRQKGGATTTKRGKPKVEKKSPQSGTLQFSDKPLSDSSSSSGGSRGKGRPAGMSVGGSRSKASKDATRKVNPFGKRATKDPTVESQLENASKRVSAIRNQMKQILDDLKGEKNPNKKEQLRQKLKQLERQLSSSYIVLERIKGVSGLTSQVGKENYETMRDLYRDTEKLNDDLAKAQGKGATETSLFKAAQGVTRSTGSNGFLDLFQDEPKSSFRSKLSTSKEDAEKYFQTNDEPDVNTDFDAEVGEQPGDDEIPDTESQDDDETPQPDQTGTVMNPEFFMSELDAERAAAEREKAEMEKAEWNAKYRDPYEDETEAQRKRRIKREKKAVKESDDLANAGYVRIDSRVEQLLDEYGAYPEARELATSMKEFSFVSRMKAFDPIAQEIKKGGFRKPQQRVHISPEEQASIERTLKKLDVDMPVPATHKITQGLIEVRARAWNEQNDALAKAILSYYAVDAEGNLTSYGKDAIKAMRNLNSNLKYERNEARDFFSNLAASARTAEQSLFVHTGDDAPERASSSILSFIDQARRSGDSPAIPSPYFKRDQAQQRFQANIDGNPLYGTDTDVLGRSMEGAPDFIRKGSTLETLLTDKVSALDTVEGQKRYADAQIRRADEFSKEMENQGIAKKPGGLYTSSDDQERFNSTNSPVDDTKLKGMNTFDLTPTGKETVDIDSLEGVDDETKKILKQLQSGEKISTPELDAYRKRMDTLMRANPQSRTARVIQDIIDGSSLTRINRPRESGRIRPKKGSQADIRQRLRNKAVDKRMQNESLIRQSKNWDDALVDIGFYSEICLMDSILYAEHSEWAKLVKEQHERMNRLSEEPAFVTESVYDGKLIRGLHKKIAEDIDFLLSDKGIEWFETYSKTLSSMTATDRIHFKLAEQQFKETNPYHFLQERILYCQNVVERQGTDWSTETTPITHIIQKERVDTESPQFHKALMEVATEELNHSFYGISQRLHESHQMSLTSPESYASDSLAAFSEFCREDYQDKKHLYANEHFHFNSHIEFFRIKLSQQMEEERKSSHFIWKVNEILDAQVGRDSVPNSFPSNVVDFMVEQVDAKKTGYLAEGYSQREVARERVGVVNEVRKTFVDDYRMKGFNESFISEVIRIFNFRIQEEVSKPTGRKLISLDTFKRG